MDIKYKWIWILLCTAVHYQGSLFSEKKRNLNVLKTCHELEFNPSWHLQNCFPLDDLQLKSFGCDAN